MKRIFKKTLGVMVVAIMMILAFSCMTGFADEYIPDCFPEGTQKVYDGIYFVPDSCVVGSRYLAEQVNIGTVPALGTICNPGAFSRITMSSSDEWISMRSSEEMRVNFVGGNLSVFGSNYYSWPKIGLNENGTYYIEIDYYGFDKSKTYQLQCTSVTSSAKNNVIVSLAVSSYKWGL